MSFLSAVGWSPWLIGALVGASLSSGLTAPSSFCDGTDSALSTSRDLYCIELVPAVGIRAGSGRVELGRAPGPFTVDVSPDGHLRYTPAVTLSGLPRPASLGRYAAFVAWVASPTMDVIQRLGAVDNGRNVLPAISLDKFIVLLTAEGAAPATEIG